MTDKATTDKRAIERVYANHRDMVMTWEEITEELIWDARDPEGPEHQPIAPERLESFCKRFPHFAERLRGYVETWNREDHLTPEALAAIEVRPEQTERGFHFAMWAMRFYDKLRRVEKDRDDLVEALRDTMALLREESGSDDPMEPFAYDERWEALAKRNDALISKVKP